MLPSVGPQRMADQNLSARLDALAELVRIGRARQAQNGQPQGNQPQNGLRCWWTALIAYSTTAAGRSASSMTFRIAPEGSHI